MGDSDDQERKRRKLNDTLVITPTAKFKGQRVEIGQPRELACFSYSNTRKLLHDNSALLYYHPMTQFDLNAGFETRIERAKVPEHLDALIESMTKNDLHKHKFNFVTWRGIMTKLFCLPFDTRDSFILQATRVDDSIYIEEVETEDKKKREARTNEREARMAYWGISFENLSTHPVPLSKLSSSDKQALAVRAENQVNTNVQYCSVFKSRIGKHSVLLGAEVDCAMEEIQTKGDTNMYAELKTSRVIENPRQEQTFEKKLLKFFAQSFLAGVPRIIVAFRDDDGIVKSTQTFKTIDIPRMVRGKVDWDSNICLAFLNNVLDWMSRTVVDEDIYTIRFEKNGTELSSDKGGDSFLPKEFLESRV
jgi:RAT1-interacting protein